MRKYKRGKNSRIKKLLARNTGALYGNGALGRLRLTE